jgi:hypothetical protein
VTCVLDELPSFILSSSTFTRPLYSRLVSHCNPHHSKICYIPDLSTNTRNDPCLDHLVKGAVSPGTPCHYQCRNSTSLEVTTIAPNVFAITHRPPGSHIKCGDTLLPFTNDTSYGSILTEIHCNCTIFLPDEQHTITPIYPCAERPLPLLQTHIIPSQWTTLAIPALPSLDISTLPRYSHLAEIIDKDWFESMSVPDFLSEYQPPQDFPSIVYAQVTSMNLILLVWNILLTVMVVYVAFRLHQIFTLLPLLAVTKAISNRPNTPQRCNLDPYLEFLLNLIAVIILSKFLAKGMIGLWRYLSARNRLVSLSPTRSPPVNPVVSGIDTHTMMGRNTGSRPENTVYDLGSFRALHRIDRSDNLVRSSPPPRYMNVDFITD